MGELHTKTFSCYWHSGCGFLGGTRQPGAGQLRDIHASHGRGARALEAAPHRVLTKTMWISSGEGGGSEKNGRKQEQKRRKRF